MNFTVKKYNETNVLDAAKKRIQIVFDNFERIYLAFSGGKDSTVLFHLVMEEAIKRNVKIGVMYIDFEAQYKDTIDHVKTMFDMYRSNIDRHWICVEMKLRNAVTNYEPQWVCWDKTKKDIWIRPMPFGVKTERDYPFCLSRMEFEEFVPMFGEWYSQEKMTAGFIAIRADESLHRYCAIATWEKAGLMFNDHRWTTKK